MKELKEQEFIWLIEDYKRVLKNEQKSDVYIHERETHIKELLSYMEQNELTRAKDITRQHLDDFFKYLQSRPNERRGGNLSTSTIKKVNMSIKGFWKFLDSEDLTIVNLPTRNFKDNDKLIKEVLTIKEIELLYSVTDKTAIGIRDRAMLALYYGCGLRKAEGLKVQLPDIDFGKGRILIRKSKNNAERYVMMSPKVQAQIEEYVYYARDLYLPENTKYENLLIGARGNPPCAEAIAKRMAALWERVKQKHDINKHITLHCLRHSIGTHLYSAGMDLEKIALMLGHKVLESTQVYIHLAEKIKQ